jgi:hypothetical protein
MVAQIPKGVYTMKAKRALELSGIDDPLLFHLTL